MPDPSPAQKARLYHRLQLAAHRLQKTADRAVMEAAELTTAQAAVLAVISLHEPAPQRLVATQLGLNESAVTAMVGRLLKLGLLDRVRDEDDARAWKLSVSKDGRAAMKRIEKPFRGVNAKIEATLSDKEIAQLADYLTRLGAAFS